MTVQLYDTKAQALRDFVPLDPGNVTIYVCGPFEDYALDPFSVFMTRTL